MFTDPRDWAHAAQDLLATANAAQTERLLIATEVRWDLPQKTTICSCSMVFRSFEDEIYRSQPS